MRVAKLVSYIEEARCLKVKGVWYSYLEGSVVPARLLPIHNTYATEIQICIHIPSGIRVRIPVYELQTTLDTPERAVNAVGMQYRKKLFICPSRKRMMDRDDMLFHPVLTAVLGGGNPSASRPGFFTPGKAAQSPVKQMAVSTGQHCSMLWRKRSFASAGNRTRIP